MYNVHLSWFPSQIWLTIKRGALRKKKKGKMKLINKKKEGGESELELQKRRRVEGMDGWIYAFTRSNAGSHPCPPHN